jgi:hypothetical protein
MDWSCGSRNRVPALQAQSPELILQSQQQQQQIVHYLGTKPIEKIRVDDSIMVWRKRLLLKKANRKRKWILKWRTEF